MPREKNPEAASSRKRAPRKAPEAAAAVSPAPTFLDPEQRAALIARGAYFRAQRRSFEPGGELADWLAAEAEVDAELLRGAAKSTSG